MVQVGVYSRSIKGIKGASVGMREAEALFEYLVRQVVV
jgi:hypothetical protein